MGLSLGVLGALVVSGSHAQAIYPTNPVQTILRAAGDGPVDIALSADDSVYVLNQNGSVVVFNANLDDSRAYPVGDMASAIAINSNNPANPRDDSVYITSAYTNNLIVYSNGMDDSRTVSFTAGIGPGAIAVDQNDDTVYLGLWGIHQKSLVVLKGANLDDSATYPLLGRARSIAVDSGDDTIYIANSPYPAVDPGDSFGLTYSGPTFDDSAFLPLPLSGYLPSSVAVSATDDSVYVGLDTSGTVAPSRLLVSRANVDDSQVRTLAAAPSSNALAVTVALDGSTVYVVNTDGASGPLYALRSTNLDDSSTVNLPSSGNNFPQAVVASGTTAYTANNAGDSMSVVRNSPAPAITSISPASGLPAGGNVVTISGAGFVNLVSTVKLGGAVVAGAQVTSPTTITFTAPAHAAGSVDVTVTTGQLSATVLNGYTWTSPPPDPPSPVYAPSAPRDVAVTAGDRLGRVSWAVPVSSGSYPITHYRATAMPGGHACLVPATELRCEITGLTNGTSYEVTVEALNGAGWSPSSSPPATFTPRGAVLITGSRDGRRIQITGQAAGWAGQTVIPRFKLAGQTVYNTGLVRPTIGSSGAFFWSRLAARKVFVYVKVSTVRSNRVIIAGAR